MLHRFHPKPTYWLLVCLLAVVVTVATSAPPALAQSTYSRLGYKNYVINYGSYALMDRPASNTSTGVSWQLLISYVYVGQGAWLVQSVWVASPPIRAVLPIITFMPLRSISGKTPTAIKVNAFQTLP